jgi:hypothetical protein
MAQDSTSRRDRPQTTPGWAPWSTRRRMLLLGVAGPVLAVLLLAIGAYLLAIRHGGQALIGVGATLLVFWLIALPLARRRRKV